jgi:hypothetical protein
MPMMKCFMMSLLEDYAGFVARHRMMRRAEQGPPHSQSADRTATKEVHDREQDDGAYQ